jgi:hypothetical protein
MTNAMSDLPSIAGHEVIFEAPGVLKPWAAWRVALQKEMSFYQQCPLDHGYPRFVCETFLDADWNPSTARTDIIPATQNGLGILSYLKYYEFVGRSEGAYLKSATLMGDYLVHESSTPDAGVFPRFTRSTGRRAQFPQAPDAGSQSDRPFEIEPDKGAIAGYALGLLSRASGDEKYLKQALHNARMLRDYQLDGEAGRSPFPFRVDYRDGAARGPVSGNMSFILRLYDFLLSEGYDEFATPRRALWRWIEDHQIPSAEIDGSLFAQFFEDHDTPTNRSAWAPLNLARYLLERRDGLTPNWLPYAHSLVEFTRDNFTHTEFGVRVCHEQDEDHQAWGGINSTYGAVLALCAQASGSENLAREARAALNYTLYLIDERGRPRDVFTNQSPGGWQEDAHTDVIHNFVDAMRAYPEWADS